jgi:hypothetical protein
MSAHGVIDAAMSAQPSAATPATAQTTIGTTPEVMSRTPLLAVSARASSGWTPKSRVAAGWSDEEAEADRGDGDAGEDGERRAHVCHSLMLIDFSIKIRHTNS